MHEMRRNGELGSKPHVAVVGAGLSGLRCADVLLQHGFQVTIIEGRDRIGGRVHQQLLGNGHLVDLGANWIHGTDENPIFNLAKQTGTLTGIWDASSHVYDDSGTLLSQEEGESNSTMMWDIIQEAFAYSNNSSTHIDETLSLLDFFKERVKVKIPETEQGFERRRQIILQMSEDWGAFVGSPVSSQSLKFFWLEECLDGENLFCAGTYAKILAQVSGPALSGAEILYNSIVDRISYRIDPEEQVSLRLSNGNILSFDEVVLTTPLGWLKQNLEAFDPPLPIRLTGAIRSIGYGCLEKIYISFPNAFWLASADGERKVHGFAQWISPTYHEDGNPQRWSQEIVDLASLAPEAAHPTLLFYFYGEQSKYLTSKLHELESAEARDKFLLGFFHPYYSRLPNYCESSPDCKPTCCLVTDWLHDELAGNGSYSNFQIGLENGDEDVKVMRHGLPEHGLWLAGEHTAPFVALGTVTGAYWSGESVGGRIAEAYGLPTNQKKA